MYEYVLNIIFLCRKMVKIRVDLMIKLQQFSLLPYCWSKNPLRRTGNNCPTWNSQLRRNGNKRLNLWLAIINVMNANGKNRCLGVKISHVKLADKHIIINAKH